MAILTGLVQTATPALAAEAKPKPATAPSTKPAPGPPAQVTNPGSKLGKNWNTSKDRAVTGAAGRCRA